MDDAVNDLASAHLRDAVVDLGELDPMRDETLGIESPIAHHADVTRYVLRGQTLAAVRAAQDFAEVQRQCVKRKFPFVLHYTYTDDAADVAGQRESSFQDCR